LSIGFLLLTAILVPSYIQNMAKGDGIELMAQALSRLGINIRDVVRLPVDRAQSGNVVYYANDANMDYHKAAQEGSAALLKHHPIAEAWRWPQNLIGFFYRDGTIAQAKGSDILMRPGKAPEFPTFVLMYKNSVHPANRRSLACNRTARISASRFGEAHSVTLR